MGTAVLVFFVGPDKSEDICNFLREKFANVHFFS